MARRNGRKGNYLMADDYTGFTVWATDIREDYWGNLTRHPLLRNLQEIATPLNDPQPVPQYRGPQYEYFFPCDAEVIPTYVGLTNVLTTTDNMAVNVLDLNPAIPDMSVGCTFVVR